MRCIKKHINFEIYQPTRLLQKHKFFPVKYFDSIFFAFLKKFRIKIKIFWLKMTKIADIKTLKYGN